MDFETMLTRKQPVHTQIEIVLDEGFADECGEARFNQTRAEQKIEAAQREIDDSGPMGASESALKRLSDAQDELERANAEVERLREIKNEHVITFKFRALSPREFDELVKRYRPTDAQKAEARHLGLQPPAWDVVKFPPALVAAALVSPEWTVEQIEQLYASTSWNPAELQAIYQVAEAAIGTRRVVDLGEG